MTWLVIRTALEAMKFHERNDTVSGVPDFQTFSGISGCCEKGIDIYFAGDTISLGKAAE